MANPAEGSAAAGREDGGRDCNTLAGSALARSPLLSTEDLRSRATEGVAGAPKGVLPEVKEAGQAGPACWNPA